MRTFIATLAAVLCVPVSALAQVDADAAASAKRVAPFLDDQTIIVAQVDLQKIDIPATVDESLALFPVSGDGAATAAKVFAQIAEGVKKQIVDSGARELFVVLSMADVPQPGPFAVMPCPEDSDPQKLADLVRGIVKSIETPPGLQVTPLEGAHAVFVGYESAKRRLETQQPSERKELAAAFAGAGPAAIRVAWVPSPDQRRVIRESLPTLPAELGAGSAAPLTERLSWAALALDVPPKPALRLVLQSDDPAAAQSIGGVIQTGIGLVASQADAQREVPGIEQLAKLLAPRVDGPRVTITLNEKNNGVDLLFKSLSQPVRSARGAAFRTQSMNNLKQIGLAMHNFHDAYRHFPASAEYSKDGKPLLSWRVRLLPYLDQAELYQQFHLDEPWDSEHNRKLIDKMPKVFRCPSSHAEKPGVTTYLVPVGNGALFQGKTGPKIASIRDGTSNTIMVVEADDEQAVVWTKPDDWEFDPKNPSRGLADHHDGGFLALLADGSVQVLSKKTDPAKLRALFTRDGGEVIGQ